MRLRPEQIRELLGQLLGRAVHLHPVSEVHADSNTFRGLVTESNHLVAVVAGDLAFAHQSGAALAMVPNAMLEDINETTSQDLLENYTEVANVLSRLVNEASKDRIRLDPGIVHDEEALQAIVDQNKTLARWQADIEGYGTSHFGIWVKAA